MRSRRRDSSSWRRATCLPRPCEQTLVIRNTCSRRPPARAWPMRVSLSPSWYSQALSMNVMPSSTAAWTMRTASRALHGAEVIAAEAQRGDGGAGTAEGRWGMASAFFVVAMILLLAQPTPRGGAAGGGGAPMARGEHATLPPECRACAPVSASGWPVSRARPWTSTSAPTPRAWPRSPRLEPELQALDGRGPGRPSRALRAEARADGRWRTCRSAPTPSCARPRAARSGSGRSTSRWWRPSPSTPARSSRCRRAKARRWPP